MSELEQYQRQLEIKIRKIHNISRNKSIDEIIEDMCFEVMRSYQDDTILDKSI